MEVPYDIRRHEASNENYVEEVDLERELVVCFLLAGEGGGGGGDDRRGKLCGLSYAIAALLLPLRSFPLLHSSSDPLYHRPHLDLPELSVLH